MYRRACSFIILALYVEFLTKNAKQLETYVCLPLGLTLH